MPLDSLEVKISRSYFIFWSKKIAFFLISTEIAFEIEAQLNENFVALDGFPPIKFEREVLMPIQQEQIRASERLETLNFKVDSLRNEMETRFESVDHRFQSMDERFRVLNWMLGILMAMVFAIFGKIFWGM